MEKVKNFRDLQVWQRGHVLTKKIYEISKAFPKEEVFGITSQLRRAASSVGANIAEGFERYHSKDKIRFYHQARGSLSEVQNFLLLSRDLQYITELICQELDKEADEIRQLLNGLIRSINN